MSTMPGSRPESLEQIAERLRCLRIALGFSTQVGFCAEIDIPHRQWNNYERAVSRIRVDEAILLVQRYGITLDWIYLGNRRWMPNELLEGIDRQLQVA